MRIIIIGASGLIGSHLFSLAKEEGHDVIGTYYSRPKKGLLRYEMRTESLRSIVPDLGKDDLVYLLSGLNPLILPSISVFFGFLGIISPYDPKI